MTSTAWNESGSAVARISAALRRVGGLRFLTSPSELAILGAAAAAALLLGGVGPYWVRLAELVLIYAAASQALDLVSGYGGQFSLGHSGLFAIGAYTAAIAWTRLDLPFLVCVLLALAVAGGAGALVGGPSLRIGGLYLALVTLAFAFIVANIANDAQSLTNGPTGIGPLQPSYSDRAFDRALGNHYLLVIALAFALAWVALRRIIRSRWGRALIAIRESSELAQAVGVQLRTTKITAFVVSAALTGVAGALFAHLGYISPHDMTWQLSVTFLVIVFLGGIGTLTGALLGAAIVIVVPERISAAPDLRLVLYGAVLIVVMVAAPRGILGGLASVWRLALRSPLGRRAEALTVGLLRPPAPTAPPEAASGEAAPARPRPPLAVAPASGDGGLRATGVSKAYLGVRALREASLELRRGELVGLIGPNGSGKTTFLNCLGGQVRSDGGTIWLGGARVEQRSASHRAARGLRRTFQHGALCPSLSCRENVMLGGHLVGRLSFAGSIAAVRRRYAEEGALAAAAETMLDYLAVPEEFRGRRPDEIPYGLRRLVELGVALVGKPGYLLLDEPAAGLVDEEIARLDGVLRDLLSLGMGIVLVEHHLQLVMNLAHTVIVLDGGEVIAVGSPREVIADATVQKAYLGEGWAARHPRSVQVQR